MWDAIQCTESTTNHYQSSFLTDQGSLSPIAWKRSPLHRIYPRETSWLHRLMVYSVWRVRHWARNCTWSSLRTSILWMYLMAANTPSLQTPLCHFQHFPQWNWDKLPLTYRESPFINLDFHLLNVGESSPHQSSPDSIGSSPRKTSVDDCHSDEPPTKKPKLSSEETDSPSSATLPAKPTHSFHFISHLLCYLIRI